LVCDSAATLATQAAYGSGSAQPILGYFGQIHGQIQALSEVLALNAPFELPAEESLLQ